MVSVFGDGGCGMSVSGRRGWREGGWVGGRVGGTEVEVRARARVKGSSRWVGYVVTMMMMTSKVMRWLYEVMRQWRRWGLASSGGVDAMRPQLVRCVWCLSL